jgi:hypothetical protein
MNVSWHEVTFLDSQLLRNPEKIAAARAELRRKHADAAAIPDLIDLVGLIHHV